MSEYQPDWSKAPSWAQFWARCADGQAWWHKYRPTETFLTFYNDGISERDTNACPNWRETLQERPVAPDRNDWSGAPDWAKARAWDANGIENWLDTANGNCAEAGWLVVTRWKKISDYRWPAEDWKDSLLLRPTDNTTEIRTIREELAALTERLTKLEEGV
jgi:hypothetical protein